MNQLRSEDGELDKLGVAIGFRRTWECLVTTCGARQRPYVAMLDADRRDADATRLVAGAGARPGHAG